MHEYTILVTSSRYASSWVRKRWGLSPTMLLYPPVDLQGPDAAAFLDRVYANAWSSLAIGRAGYGLMLREDGFVMDDGTTARLGPEHFLMTTTTANADAVVAHLEFCRQVLWPELDVQIASVTVSVLEMSEWLPAASNASTQ